jgi:adenylate cyclase
MKRKIAALMAADVAEYSRLVAEDEEETLRRLLSYRSVIDEFIARASGRIFNTAGDAVLAEFPSAVEAVRCAIDIQESVRTRNLAYPPSRHMKFRIGITVGDVVEREGDLLGDAVNIAARLEGLAEPGGICVSRTVYEGVANKLSVQFADIGEQHVKNIPTPIHVYRVAVSGTTGALWRDKRSNFQLWLGSVAAALILAVIGAGWLLQSRQSSAPSSSQVIATSSNPVAGRATVSDDAVPTAPPSTAQPIEETKAASVSPPVQTTVPSVKAAYFCLDNGGKTYYEPDGTYRFVTNNAAEFKGKWSGSPEVGGKVEITFPNGAMRHDRFLKEGNSVYLVDLKNKKFLGRFCKS